MIKHKIHYMVSIIGLVAICLSACTSASKSESNSANKKADTQVNSRVLSIEQKTELQKTVPDKDSKALVI